MAINRIAYCSPLPPQQSGIADYSAELLPRLAEHFERVDLFNPGSEPPPAELGQRFSVHPLAALPDRAPYDAVLYHVGNDARFHGAVYEMALGLPGIVVLHEYMLHHLVRALTVDRNRPEAYVAAMRYCYGEGGARAARRFLDIGAGRDRWTFPLFERLVDASRGVIVHNEASRRRVLASRPGARIVKVPHHLCLDALPGATGVARDPRDDLGLPAAAFVVATFGILNEAKRLEVVLAAFARLHRRHPEALLLLVGDPSPHPALARMLDGELGEAVVCTGRVELDTFLRYMEATDVAVNLRHPTGGETSGTVIRLLGMGKAVIVSNAGSFAELPDDCCIKVDLDEHEEDSLLTALLTLAEEDELRRRVGENARRYMAERHSIERSARGYAEAIRSLAAERPLLAPAAAPGADPPGDPVSAAIVGDLGCALHDVGVDESEAGILDVVAGVLRELDLA